ncbi:MAG: phosphatidylglycerol lysyltransferase domain-containing protein [Desulfomonilaceae bacterium]|nr:phosphatidylglycerol lysyltransferase domain-containing protein [Desulfomonilaceae bacterium]
MNDFKLLTLKDKEVFDEFLAQDPPRTSELTFTNLFMWRVCNDSVWKMEGDCILVILRPETEPPFGLPPFGPGDKASALRTLSENLTGTSTEPRIARVDRNFVERYVDPDEYRAIADRNHSDYVYLSEDLINLPGNRYHRKKNHLNKFVKNYEFEYRRLDEELVKSFMELQEDWCELKDCESNQDLSDENVAVYEALKHYKSLDYRGGAILIDSKVEAFALGEELNRDTAVIHIEKANPEIPGLYVAINQRFCAAEWAHLTYVNREQDLGVPGLRKAKESYNPNHMVDKFVVAPRRS